MSTTVPRKSESDARKYRVVTLTNRLQVLLVSDADTEKASAAMNCGVGHFLDPDDLPGRAHFLEHMLFLGTKKYPDEGEYSAFLSQHGGRSNAYTSSEETNYYFDVGHQYLEAALDRFGQFFLHPLFTESATSREMHAVDAENSKNLLVDRWRLSQLMRTTANPMHPFHKFGTGNLKTLQEDAQKKGLNARQLMMDFYTEYYSSNIMKLAIIGREPLDTLQNWATDTFGAIQDKNVTRPHWEGEPYRASELKTLFKIVPVKDLRSLELLFPVPSMRPFYHQKPSRYISHLIGHEGPGSLLCKLKDLGLVNELSAGCDSAGSDFEFFHITMTLTEEGARVPLDIVTHVFQYIHMMKRAGVQKWVFDEIATVAETKFRFKEKEEPINYSSSIASSLHDYTPDDVLAGPYLFFDYDPSLIEKVWDCLRPDNMRVSFVSKEVEAEANITEPWYGTKYCEEAIPDKWIELWKDPPANDAYHLPALNPFIATDFALKDPSLSTVAEYPVKIKNEGLGVVWYKLDRTFLLPRAALLVKVTMPVSFESPTSSIMSRLFVDLVDDALNEYLYDAEIAGLSYDLAYVINGLQVTVYGYNDKLFTLARAVFEKIAHLQITDERFAIIRDKASRNYKNTHKEQPHFHASYTTNFLLEAKRWHYEEYISIVDTITAEQLRTFVPRLIKEMALTILVHGNVAEAEALAFFAEMEKILGVSPLHPSQIPERRMVDLRQGYEYVHTFQEPSNENENSAVFDYYQIGMAEDHHTNVLVDLLAQISNKPVFHQLRTVEQLGYIVWSGVHRMNGVQGFFVCVQSPKKTADELSARVEAFLFKFKELLQQVSADDFAVHVQSLSQKKLEPPKRLDIEASRYWNEILLSTFVFDRVFQEVEVLKNVTHENLQKFYEKIALIGATSKKLSVRVKGSAMRAANEHPAIDKQAPLVEAEDPMVFERSGRRSVPIEDKSTFKRALPLHPLPGASTSLYKGSCLPP